MVKIMTEQEIIDQRDPEHKYYETLGKYKEKYIWEIIDNYGNNEMVEDDYHIIYIDNNICVRGVIYDKINNEYYLVITNKPGVFGSESVDWVNDEWDTIDSKIKINPDFRFYRVLISSPNYHSHSEDIFTKEELEYFNTIIHNSWNNVSKATRKLFIDIYHSELPLELPIKCPDYNLLPSK